uniref:phosphoribosylaminoimidazole carboxylase n=1 Tax=Calcidiscus leptoporus TaxID=127549 RepID=A0A7S0ILS7_9EUKA|mmetsp:Transcript_12713/g.29338  ORF Transcript_12713/g.29338 Transcript_12713/m.29338 type:complete len:559 (+) Transcript_12713:41-1717(+)
MSICDQRVGVLGGGQLGRMMAQAAHRLGIHMVVLDPAGLESPAGKVSGHAVKGSFQEAAKIEELAAMVEVITVEIEHIETAALETLAVSGRVKVHPAPSTLRTIQDKLKQKRHLSTVAGVRLGDFADAEDVDAVLAKGREWGFPLMLKARTAAYDGRGNAVVEGAAEVAAAFASLSQGGAVKLYVERWCPFECELAVMVARSPSGEVVTYPTVMTEQRNSMCHAVLAPAQVAAETSEAARRIAAAAVASFEGAGIFGVELFAMRDGAVLLNEIAPRPHNSGHYTLDACYTEQHEQHLRAVLGLPLGSASMKVEAVAMLNVIGSDDAELHSTLAPIARAMSMPRAAVHWYGKAPPKPRRKMGHINVCASSIAEAKSALSALQDVSEDLRPTPLVGIIMGSDSDLPTMRSAAEVLESFGVVYELTIVSAHRTPQRLYEYSTQAEQRGLRVIIAGAGGAAHLPGMAAAMTPLPVIGVPVKTVAFSGNDSLLSIVQMPKGVPVATVAIGNATNAGLLAVRMLGMADHSLRTAMSQFMQKQETEVLMKAARLEEVGYDKYTAP